MAVAIELTLYPLSEVLQGVFALAGPVMGYAMAGSIAYLFLRASLKWMNLL